MPFVLQVLLPHEELQTAESTDFKEQLKETSNKLQKVLPT